ncbi:MAG: hypothetical protein WCL04_10775 [Verrucomicrobiota bacterium]
MRLHAVLTLFLLLMVAAMRAQSEETGIEFNGVLVTGGKTTVSLVNPTTGESGWVAVGRKFGGRTVTAYNAADAKAGRPSDAVVLTRDSDGRSETIPLKGAPIVTTARTSESSNLRASSRQEPVFSLPPGARLSGLIDPSRPTEVGQVSSSETPASNGKIQLTEVSLEGYIKIDDGSTDGVYQPIYSIREMIMAPENVAAAKNATLDRVAQRKISVSQQQVAPTTPPQLTTQPAKVP